MGSAASLVGSIGGLRTELRVVAGWWPAALEFVRRTIKFVQPVQPRVPQLPRIIILHA